MENVSGGLRGKPAADALDLETKKAVQALRERGVIPTLAILRVGEKSEDLSYERGAMKRCAADGIEVRQVLLPEDVSQAELLGRIQDLNEDSTVHGILMFRPLPKTLDEQAACAVILPEKDVDGVTAGSMAAVYAGKGAGFAPCTAEAVITMLRYYQVPLRGSRAVVVGRSLVIGKPVAMLLLAEHATVTICHSRTTDLPAVTREADLVVAALGRAEFLGAEYFRAGQTVIDVGINWSGSKQKLVGDVDTEAALQAGAAVSPVPGGVGSVTTAVLASHVARAAQGKQEKKRADLFIGRHGKIIL